MTPRPPRKKGVRKLRVGDLSREILNVLAERFIVRTNELYAYVPRTAKDPEDHERSIRRSLKLLRESVDALDKKDPSHKQWGLICSVPWSDPAAKNHFDYTCYAHGLTHRGVRLVRELKLEHSNQAKSLQEFQNVSIDHEIRIEDLLNHLASQLDSIGLELIVIRMNIKGETIASDRLIYIYNPKTDVRSAPIFLEYEKQKRGKYESGDPQIIRKCTALAQFYDSKECQEQFGFRKFYVWFVLQTDRKVDFLLGDLREHKLAIKTFMLTSEPKCATDLLGKILTTPNGSTFSLLDL